MRTGFAHGGECIVGDRIGQKASGLRKVPEAVEEVVAQAVNRYRKRLSGLSLTVRVPEEFIMAPMDSTLIEQVLINLIENAYKYGRSAQPIEVTICAEGALSALSCVIGRAFLRSFACYF